MTNGTKAMIPLEVGLPTIRTDNLNQGNNDQLMAKQLDLIEENIEKALYAWLTISMTSTEDKKKLKIKKKKTFSHENSFLET